MLLGIQLLKWIPAIFTLWIQCLAVAFSIFIQLAMGCIWNIFLLLCILNALLGLPTGEKLSSLFEVTRLSSLGNHSILSFSELLNGITTSCIQLYNKRNYCISGKQWTIRNRVSLSKEMTVPFCFQILASDLF